LRLKQVSLWQFYSALGIFKLNFIDAPYLRHVGVMAGDSEENLKRMGLLSFSHPIRFSFYRGS